MTRAELIHHNARLIRAQVRGKSPAERKAIYEIISAGAHGLILHAIMAIGWMAEPVTININYGVREDVRHSIERAALTAARR